MSEARLIRKPCLKLVEGQNEEEEPWSSALARIVKTKIKAAPDLLISPETDIVWCHMSAGYHKLMQVDRYMNLPTNIDRLALNYTVWNSLVERTNTLFPEKYEDSKKLWFHNAWELILVVNDKRFSAAWLADKEWFDRIFTKPNQKKPEKIIKSYGMFHHLHNRPHIKITWELLEHNALIFLDSMSRHGPPGDPWRSNIESIRYVEAKKKDGSGLSKKKALLARDGQDVYFRE